MINPLKHTIHQIFNLQQMGVYLFHHNFPIDQLLSSELHNIHAIQNKSFLNNFNDD